MNSLYFETIRANCPPIAARPTGVQARLHPLPDIRALMFDIYGTLMISDSGEIGLGALPAKATAIAAACEALGLRLEVTAAEAVERFERAIRAQHARAREEGIAFPEVKIDEIWRRVLPGCLGAAHENVDVLRFSIEFEVRINPTWPMPDLERCFAELRHRDMIMGIVSNAQFFTPLLFPALVGKSLRQLGCSPDLTYFSFEHGQAKPGTFLYQQAQRQLARRGLKPHQALYVGNDMLNDVAAASEVGFRTALFAGDQRSLRWREGHARVAGIEPDVVLTGLSQLVECLSS